MEVLGNKQQKIECNFDSENNFGYYSFTLIRIFMGYKLYKRSQTTQYKNKCRIVPSKELGLTQREVWPLSPVPGK